MMGLVIGGIVLIGIGVALLLARRRAQGQLLEIRFLKSTPVGELLSLQGSIAGEIGPGGFNQLVETTGTIACDEPLEAELSEQRCAHYRMQVEERYEESYVERDSQGRETMRTRTGSTTVASNTRSARFYVADGEHRIAIAPDGAKLDLHQTVDRFEPATAGGRLQFGAFAIDWTPSLGPQRRILGYHYAEWVLPLGARVYVIGQASDGSGEVTIGRPDQKDKPFIVSMKSEEEVTRGMAGKAQWLLIGAIAAMAGGAALIVAGVMR